MRLTDSTELKLLANGFVAAFEGTGKAVLVGKADQFECGDFYEGYPAFLSDPNYEGDWYPDSPSDLIQRCTAPRASFENGSACTAGHSHRFDVTYYDADEVASLVRQGYALAPNARLMDGTPL